MPFTKAFPFKVVLRGFLLLFSSFFLFLNSITSLEPKDVNELTIPMQDFYCFKTCDLIPSLYITEACDYKNKEKRSREKHKGKTKINIASC